MDPRTGPTRPTGASIPKATAGGSPSACARAERSLLRGLDDDVAGERLRFDSCSAGADGRVEVCPGAEVRLGRGSAAHAVLDLTREGLEGQDEAGIGRNANRDVAGVRFEIEPSGGIERAPE